MDKEQETNEKEIEESEQNDVEKILKDIDRKEERNVYNIYKNTYNYGIISGDNTQFEKIEIDNSADKGNSLKSGIILTNEDEMIKWINNNYSTYSMALIIASAVFDCLQYQWIIKAADTLYESFSPSDDEEKRHGITDILKQFGGKICKGEMNTYIGKIPVEVIQLASKEDREKILKCIWKECPQLQISIILWLKKYNGKKPISMSKRVTEIMGLFACVDTYFFMYEMVNMIYQDKCIETDMMLAQVILFINRHKKYQDNIYNLMNAWNNRKDVHSLLTNLFICAGSNEKEDILQEAIRHYIYKSLESLHRQNQNEFLDNLYNFFASGVRSFTFYKSLIECLYELENNEEYKRKTDDRCYLFLRLFAIDIGLARFEEKEDAIFIKLCFCDHEVSDKICYLWTLVWQCRRYRDAFYAVLTKYDICLKQQGNSHNLDKFIKKAFKNVCTEEIQHDICNKIHMRAKNE